MNDYMKTEVTNIRLLINTFLQKLELAALQDDEKITKSEAKALKQVRKASNKYLKDLEKAI